MLNSHTIQEELEGARPGRATLAWGVHAFTASGAVVGTVALLAILQGNLMRAGVLMLVALVIDSVDGTLARAARVSEVLPSFNGRRLDDMVDFLNYVIVPVVFLIAAGSLASWHWSTLPILASAYGFSQENAKTDDDFFLGFPSYWNVVALYLWMLDISPAIGTAIVALLSVLVFVPLKYLYPSKMLRFRNTVAVAAGLWLLAMLGGCVAPEIAARLRLVELSLSFPALYLGLSFWLGGLHRAAR
jgi:phosphatidylcholine synthase